MVNGLAIVVDHWYATRGIHLGGWLWWTLPHKPSLGRCQKWSEWEFAKFGFWAGRKQINFGEAFAIASLTVYFATTDNVSVHPHFCIVLACLHVHRSDNYKMHRSPLQLLRQRLQLSRNWSSAAISGPLEHGGSAGCFWSLELRWTMRSRLECASGHCPTRCNDRLPARIHRHTHTDNHRHNHIYIYI